MDEENFSEHDLSGQESIVLPPAAKPGAFQIIFSISFVLFVVVLALELIGRKNPEFPYTPSQLWHDMKIGFQQVYPKGTTIITITKSATPTPIPHAMTRINPQDRAIYVWIPPGEFMMGASIVDSSTYEDEQPQHRVRLDGFWLMQTEVTNAQYKRCVEAKVCARPSNVRWSDSTYADHPVVDVAWTQADRYAEWVGGRLPTEAEWEKACTGTDGSRYPWGNQAPDPHLLNYAANNKNTTMPVGSYPFGANRLYDMAGNVGEWTADWYAGNYYTDAPEHNPKGPKSGVARTLRGGSFDYYDYNVRCVARDRYAPDLRFDYLGFRVAASGD